MYVFMCMSTYVFMCMSMHVWVGEYTFVATCGGRRSMSGVLLYHSPLYFSKTKSLAEPGVHQLTRLACSEGQGSAYLIPSAGIIGIHHYT